jgi:hypothetical protein
MAAGMEVAVNERVSGEEVLGVPRRFEPLHLPLSSSRWSMRVLGPIIQIAALSLLDARKHLPLSDAVAPKLVGHNHPRLKSQTRQQPFEEARRRLGIAPGLDEDVEHNAILIHGAPEIMLHALDTDEDLIHVPLVAGSWPAASQAVGETRGESFAPASHRLIGDDDTAFRQDQLDIPQTEAEHLVQPDGVANELGREPTAVGVGWRRHPTGLVALRACCQSRLP